MPKNDPQIDKYSPQERVDLHIHSNRSDGYFSARTIIDYAHRAGLKAISITDHDNITGLEDAEKYCQQKGLEFISGIEISARGRNCDLHMLGYFIDYRSPALIEYVNFFQNERIKRAIKIIKRLNDQGFNLSFEIVKGIAGEGSVGRPHIAEALVQEGYVSNYYEAFEKYIGDGRPCTVPKYKISPEEAISLINNAGGICFLAHPGNEINDDGIYYLIKAGLQGIETIHPRHSQCQVNHYREIIQRYGLLECGGSDCHGKHKAEILIGKLFIPYQVVKKMKDWLAKNKRTKH